MYASSNDSSIPLRIQLATSGSHSNPDRKHLQIARVPYIRLSTLLRPPFCSYQISSPSRWPRYPESVLENVVD
ncbi:hypothetical protein B0H10DRAFT_2003172 [Mycena sp. CBHHK59/15]|nr:hypothetical protein B0H10DRAFT_2003172 [Mycena sp. CBHHK59/15]